ncbi:uncharacterized protein STEHIDRAFT_161113 [Stereum hirsutum FP-91666 SS1]|uniref:uncharacterized protein n=1 Tax=Stereum hirsutum (strain FP-91666) TaxID=721885 RepID=UPI000444921F|nr:uncharacterized protein STEHIDRAFT_161113 [Stereum hirsutum FP-91666 SS1]EIM82585.1 hypothetical protein STEHIDRAFT_161113 [Stereum hirsutum FP-91666 SS1]
MHGSAALLLLLVASSTSAAPINGSKSKPATKPSTGGSESSSSGSSALNKVGSVIGHIGQIGNIACDLGILCGSGSSPAPVTVTASSAAASATTATDASSNSTTDTATAQRREQGLNHNDARAATKPKTSSSGGGSSASQAFKNAGNIAGIFGSGAGIINGFENLFGGSDSATETVSAAPAATSSATTAQRRERPLNYHNARAVTKPKTSTPKTGSSSGGSSFSGLLGNVGNGAAALDSGIGIINGVKSLFDPPAPATVTAPAASAATSSATTAQRREQDLNDYEARSASKHLGTAATVAGGVDTGISIANRIKNFFDPPTPGTVTASASAAPTSAAATKRDMVDALAYLASRDLEERSAISTLLKGLTDGGDIIQDGEHIIGGLFGGSSGSSDTTSSNPTTKRDESIDARDLEEALFRLAARALNELD